MDWVCFARKIDLNHFLGCPYLASLHFRQVQSLRPTFPKIEIILAALQDAEILTAQHTSSIGLMSLQVLGSQPFNVVNVCRI